MKSFMIKGKITTSFAKSRLRESNSTHSTLKHTYAFLLLWQNDDGVQRTAMLLSGYVYKVSKRFKNSNFMGFINSSSTF